MTPVTLRAATAADLPGLERLLAVARLPVAGAAEHLPAFLVADTGGELVGSAGLEIYGIHGLLRSVAVAPASQGTGLGLRLTASALELARTRGLRTVTLLTTTAEGFFPRFGFRRIDPAAAPEPVRQSPQFNGVCPASAVAMHLDLTPTKSD